MTVQKQQHTFELEKWVIIEICNWANQALLLSLLCCF